MIEEELKVIKDRLRNEFGIGPLNVFIYNESDRSFCLTETPSLKAARKTHDGMGTKCDEIVEAKRLV